jgi:glutathione S-transferase
MLSDSELNALLDAHDALVIACVEERLTLDEFLAAYNDFPRVYGLDGRDAGADERSALRRASQRIAFHFRVLEAVSGAAGIEDESPLSADAMSAGFSEFLARVPLMRLRQLVARYPDLKALPDSAVNPSPAA